MVLAILLFLFSCKDDDYQYPAVTTDFVSVTTDARGQADSLFDDNGRKYAISVSLNNLAKDSLYRCVSQYAIEGSGIRVYTLKNIVSPDPVRFKTLKTDAVSTMRIWKGADYINIVVRSLGQSKAHRWGLNEDAVLSKPDGTHRLYFTLYHDRNGDYPAFSRETYLSFPLRKYARFLTKGDSIFVSVCQTVNNKDMMIVYPLAY